MCCAQEGLADAVHEVDARHPDRGDPDGVRGGEARGGGALRRRGGAAHGPEQGGPAGDRQWQLRARLEHGGRVPVRRAARPHARQAAPPVDHERPALRRHQRGHLPLARDAHQRARLGRRGRRLDRLR